MCECSKRHRNNPNSLLTAPPEGPAVNGYIKHVLRHHKGRQQQAAKVQPKEVGPNFNANSPQRFPTRRLSFLAQAVSSGSHNKILFKVRHENLASFVFASLDVLWSTKDIKITSRRGLSWPFILKHLFYELNLLAGRDFYPHFGDDSNQFARPLGLGCVRYGCLARSISEKKMRRMEGTRKASRIWSGSFSLSAVVSAHVV